MTAGDLKVFMIVKKTAGDKGRGVLRSQRLHDLYMIAGDGRDVKISMPLSLYTGYVGDEGREGNVKTIVT